MTNMNDSLDWDQVHTNIHALNPGIPETRVCEEPGFPVRRTCWSNVEFNVSKVYEEKMKWDLSHIPKRDKNATSCALKS